MMKKDSLVFSKENKFMGRLAGLDFIKNTVTITDDKKTVLVIPEDDAVEIRFVNNVKGQDFYEFDIFASKQDEKIYELTILEDGGLRMNLLDKKLKLVAKGNSFENSEKTIAELMEYVVFIGNRHEFKEEIEVDTTFNVKIVSMGNKYYYACNDKDLEQIDLIKVLYFGSSLLEEQKYERLTLSYEDYSDFVNEGELVEKTPNDLQRFVNEQMYNARQSSPAVETTEVEQETELDEEDDDSCGCELCRWNPDAEDLDEDFEEEEEEEENEEDERPW